MLETLADVSFSLCRTAISSKSVKTVITFVHLYDALFIQFKLQYILDSFTIYSEHLFWHLFTIFNLIIAIDMNFLYLWIHFYVRVILFISKIASFAIDSKLHMIHMPVELKSLDFQAMYKKIVCNEIIFR